MNAYMVIVWILVGMAVMGATVWFALPALMLVKHRSRLNYADTVAALTTALQQKQDWVVKAVNDYQASTAPFAALEKVGSLNVCNPRYAARILTRDADRRVTAFMPLSIGVFEDKQGQVHVSRMNVGLMGMMFGGTIADVMRAAGRDLDGVIASVVQK